MLVHPVVWAKLLVIGLVVFAIVLGVFAGLYRCFTVSAGLGVAVTVGVVIAIPTGLVLALRFLPRTVWGRALQLDARRPARGEGAPAARKERSLLGRTAVAETALRPSGAVRIDGERVIATAEAGLIEKDAAVEIIRAAGPNVVVRKIDPPPA